MAYSLAGAAALAATASAQPPSVRPSPTPNNVRVSPWPTPPRVAPAPSAVPPVVYPPMGDAAGTSPFAPPATGGFGAGSPPFRTMYFRKDSNAPVKPTPTAEVAMPVAAAQPPMPILPEAPKKPGEELPTPREATGRNDATQFAIPPTPDELFRLDSEDGFVRRENVRRKKDREDPKVKPDKKLEDIAFPLHEDLGKMPYAPRAYAAYEVLVEPNYVLHRRLLFEDRNTERYGWTIGPLQPISSTYAFFAGVQSMPYRAFSNLCQRHETGAGLCLPGDPVPQMIYPPGLSLSGALAQAGATVALHFLIP